MRGVFRSLLRQFARVLPHRRVSPRAVRSLTTMSIVHWDSKTCPYAQRSWIALVEKGLPFEIAVVDLQTKSKEFTELYASINPDPAAPAKVPILIDGDVKLIESAIICEYLAQRYAGQGVELLPADPVAAAKVRLFAETFNTHFTSSVLGIIRADSQQGVALAKEKLAQGLKVLDTFLEWHGSSEGGDFFLGGQYSLAEVLTTSFVQRAEEVLPHYRGIDVWGLVREGQLDRLERWLQAALSRPSAKETRPANDVIVSGWGKFVSPLKD